MKQTRKRLQGVKEHSNLKIATLEFTAHKMVR